MMKGKFLYKWFAAFAMIWVISSCDYFDLDINEDPNNPSQASPELLLTSAEYSIAANLAGGTNDAQLGFAGILASFDNFNMSNSSFNGIWNNLYAGPLKDLEGIIDVADVDNNGDGNPDNPHYLAIAQTLKAYVASTLVDLFGDIPYSEALQGDADATIKNPNFDTDADVYNSCIGLLDQAIANFALSSPVSIKGDAIYSGNITRWKKLANTLKLRLYVQARLAIPNPALPGTNTAPGGGIFPIITHVNTLYYQIEAVLALGSAGDGRTLFESAIRSHITKVVNFGKAADANSVTPAAADVDAYVATWLGRYDNAATNDAKLNVVMKQLWFSSWGNGYEIFNAMRRTGYPNTIQQPITPVRDFPLRLPYPQIELTLNPNASAYSSVVYDQDPVFWDK